MGKGFLNPPTVILLLVLAVLYGLILFRFVRNRLAPVKTEKAQVVGKNTVESYSKFSRGGKHTKYVVIFEVQGKKRSFYVSEFSYGGYRKGERGTLTYKGDRLIGFE